MTFRHWSNKSECRYTSWLSSAEIALMLMQHIGSKWQQPATKISLTPPDAVRPRLLLEDRLSYNLD